ncbi:MAG TPA: SigE family RNA polymerase sigma factor [Micromonosporaceae bacterium]|jgi:RNA polymerase sigma-70 factor (sigma-E family)|nr:SigE family RNA polymerase sigma factor [Micromonosporaceae bacterium]
MADSRSRATDDGFAQFMHGNAQRLCRVAYLLTGDASRAEDLAQEALARTYGAWHRVRTDDAYWYARRVLVNLHTDWWRRRWRERSVPQVPDAAGKGDPTDTTVNRDALKQALRALTPRERAVVVLRFYLDLSEAQVAQELRISTGTVKSTTSRALRKLRVSPTLTDSGERITEIAIGGTS